MRCAIDFSRQAIRWRKSNASASGNLELGSLQPGEHRTLSSEEVPRCRERSKGKLEPGSEPPIKRTQVKRPAKKRSYDAAAAKSAANGNGSVAPGSSGKRQGRNLEPDEAIAHETEESPLRARLA